MGVLASVGFAGTTGTELNAYDSALVKVTGFTPSMQITAGGRGRLSSNNSIAQYYHTATPASADYWVSTDMHIASSSSGTKASGPMVRMDSAADTGYHFRLNTRTSVGLYRRQSGSATILGSTSAVTVSAGSTYGMKIDAAGSTISVYWDGAGSPTIQQTDSNITAAGHGGFRWSDVGSQSDSTAEHVDNLLIEEAGGVTAFIPIVGRGPGMALAGNGGGLAGNSTGSS